ncbi:MAG TPA: hypothetical protein VIS95_04930 [Solirubrobacterales bacterium]
MSDRSAELERERGLARPAALAAFATVVLYVVSVILEESSGLMTGGTESEQLLSFHDSSGTLLAATCVRSVGFLLLALPLFHLFRAARLRSERVRPEMVGFAFFGPVLLAVQGLLSWLATRSVADEFVDQMTAAGRPAALAERLLDDSSFHQVASYLAIPAVLALAIGMLYISLQAMRTGLLTRFAGSLGMALGVAMILILPVALLLTMVWLVFLGLTFLGKVPGGQPPAWEAGKAIPWPTPGEKAAKELEGSGDE